MEPHHVTYYVTKDETGTRELSIRRGRPTDCRALIEGMNRARCRRCWTYEHSSHVTPDSIIPTMTYDSELKRITIPHMCLHNFGLIAALLNQVISDNYSTNDLNDIPSDDMESLIDVYVQKLNFQDCRKKVDAPDITKVFAKINLHFDTIVNPGDLALNDFMKFIQLFNYNFKLVKLLAPTTVKADEIYGHGFTMEEYGKIARVPVLTPWLMRHLTFNLQLQELHIGVFGELDMTKFRQTVQSTCRLKVLTIEDVNPGTELTDEQINGVVKICLAFKKTLTHLVVRDIDAIHIIKNLLNARQDCLCLRSIEVFYDKLSPDIEIAPANRFNYPVLTTVRFVGTDLVYEANPPIINRTTMKIYPPRCEDLYLFLTKNRRNFIAAIVWEIIATRYLGKRYSISPDIRRLISTMITHVDTSKLRFVEPSIATGWRDVLVTKNISVAPNLPGGLLYCVDDASKRQWNKINKVKLTAEKHQERRKKLAVEIQKLEAELDEDPRAKVHRIKKLIEQKRDRIDALEVYEHKLQSKLKRLKK